MLVTISGLLCRERRQEALADGTGPVLDSDRNVTGCPVVADPAQQRLASDFPLTEVD